MNIIITFHIPIDTTPAKAVAYLDFLFNEVFDDQASRVDLGNEITDEIMYVVNRPLIASNQIMDEFFNKLLNIFTSSIAYIPHFTQPPKELFEKGL